MSKILSDKYGLCAKIDGWICRPSDKSIFRFGDTVRGSHPAGPDAFLRIGKRGEPGYVVERWAVIQPSYEYKAFMGLKMSDDLRALPGHTTHTPKACFMARYFPKSIRLPELLDDDVVKIRDKGYRGMTVAHAVVEFRGTPEEFGYISGRPDLLGLLDDYGVSVAEVALIRLDAVLKRAGEDWSEYGKTIENMAILFDVAKATRKAKQDAEQSGAPAR